MCSSVEACPEMTWTVAFTRLSTRASGKWGKCRADRLRASSTVIATHVKAHGTTLWHHCGQGCSILIAGGATGAKRNCAFPEVLSKPCCFHLTRINGSIRSRYSSGPVHDVEGCAVADLIDAVFQQLCRCLPVLGFLLKDLLHLILKFVYVRSFGLHGMTTKTACASSASRFAALSPVPCW